MADCSRLAICASAGFAAKHGVRSAVSTWLARNACWQFAESDRLPMPLRTADIL